MNQLFSFFVLNDFYHIAEEISCLEASRMTTKFTTRIIMNLELAIIRSHYEFLSFVPYYKGEHYIDLLTLMFTESE